MSNLTKEQSAAFEHHMEKAKELHDKVPHDFHNTIGKHSEHFSTYINKTIRDNRINFIFK